MNDTESKLKHFTSYVPEFYFDLISRVPAGVTAVLGTIAVLGGFRPESAIAPSKLLAAGGSSLAVVSLLFLGCGYMFGIPLSSVAAWLYRPVYFRIAELPGLRPQLEWAWAELSKRLDGFNFSTKDTLDTAKYQSLQTAFFDYLRTRDEHAHHLLPKLSAEVALCANLSFVSFFLLVLYILTGGSDLRADVAALFALVIVASFIGAIFRYARMEARKCALLKSLPI